MHDEFDRPEFEKEAGALTRVSLVAACDTSPSLNESERVGCQRPFEML